MRLALSLLAVLLAFGMPARADFLLTFDQSNYIVAPGGTVQVNVSLMETGTSVLATSGLVGAGLLVDFNQPATASDPAQVIAIAPNPIVNPNAPDFDFLKTAISAAAPGSAGSAELDWSLTTNTLFPPGGGSSLVIGTFTFQAGSVVGDVTHLVTGLSGLKFVAGNGTDIDDTFGIASSTATITVRARPTPEPPSVALLSLGCLLIGARVLGRPR